ncbi:MAG: RND transporter [Deltaproteobacteria bacterium]
MNFSKIIDTMPWSFVFILCLTLGLAPFRPPHIYEKLSMLFHGELRRPLDIFDLIMHASPWILLALKLILAPWRVK